MLRRATLAICLLAPAACLQDIDADAASGDSSEEDPIVALDTPPIELPDGTTSTDPCVLTRLQAVHILEVNCAGCHGGGSPGAAQGQPPFDFVLDTERLKTARSASVPDPLDPEQGMRFAVPGDPDSSRIYVRVAANEMPPELPIGVDPIPRPSVSDISLMYTWIQSCIE